MKQHHTILQGYNEDNNIIMKGPIYLIAASVWLGVVAVGATHERRYAHEAFRDLLRRDDVTDTTCNSTCGCITIYSTHYGEATCKSALGFVS